MSNSENMQKTALLKEIDDYIASVKIVRRKRTGIFSKTVGIVDDFFNPLPNYEYLDEIRKRTVEWLEDLRITDDELCAATVRSYIDDRKKEIDRFFEAQPRRKDKRIFKYS